MGAEEMDRLLATASSISGLTRECMTVVFSHTHAAGLMDPERASFPGGELIQPYLNSLSQHVGKLIHKAAHSTEEAHIVYGTGTCNLAVQRDYFDRETDQWVCGFNPDGEADDTVLVARVTAGERTLATVVNYACHPTTLAWDNTLISPDFPGTTRELIEAHTEAPCLFLQGASGDLGPREGYVGDVKVAERNGRQLGHAALSVLESLPPAQTTFRYCGPVVSGATLGVWEHVPISAEEQLDARRWYLRRWTLPLEYRADLPRYSQVMEELGMLEAEEKQCHSLGDHDRAKELRALAERKRRLKKRLSLLPRGSFPLQIALWRMGSAFWVVLQGEHYQILQKALRKHYAGIPIMVATIASDWRVSYLPPQEIYGKGIYQEQVAVVAPGSLERVIDQIGLAIEEMLVKP